MSVDPSQFNQQPAVNDQSSSAPGSVAPPRQSQQDYGQAPGAQAQQDYAQPGASQENVVEDGQPSPPQIDYQARYEQAEQERLRVQAEANQYRQTFQQVQQFAEQQQRTQQEQHQINQVLAVAENMSSAEANTYLRNQMQGIVGQTRMTEQQQRQQMQQQFDQQMRGALAPQYVDHLIERNGLPAEAKAELLALQDPDLMHQFAPVIKQRYDQWAREKATYAQQQTQLGRSQEVNAIRQNGLAAVGGQTIGGNGADPYAGMDNDDKAMAIYNQLRANR